MRVFQGTALLEFMKDEVGIQDDWEERDFVEVARSHFEGKYQTVLVIGGLRATGKTVGLLQALRGLDACYVVAQRREKETSEDYIKLLETVDKKYIVIDEYSWVRNREELDKYLWTAVQNGKRIAVTGTDSITLDFLDCGDLIHRVSMLHVNMVSYTEYCRIFKLEPCKETCVKFLIEGGVFRKGALRNFDNMQKYVEVALIDSLAEYTKGEISKEKAKALVYSVLFKAICPNNLRKVPLLMNQKLERRNFLDRMGVRKDLVFEEYEVRRVADILEQLDVIVKVPNYDQSSPIKEQYYIANPALTSQLILAAYDLVGVDGYILGHVFEAAVMCILHYNLRSENKLYFLNTTFEDGSNKELDAVITTEKEDYVHFVECKMREDATLKMTSTILDERLEDIFPDSIVDGRFIVYNGKPCKKVVSGDVAVIYTDFGKILEDYALGTCHLNNIEDQAKDLLGI